jgi:hypothetical protein
MILVHCGNTQEVPLLWVIGNIVEDTWSSVHPPLAFQLHPKTPSSDMLENIIVCKHIA